MSIDSTQNCYNPNGYNHTQNIEMDIISWQWIAPICDVMTIPFNFSQYSNGHGDDIDFQVKTWICWDYCYYDP